jgi:hypothetical protein
VDSCVNDGLFTACALSWSRWCLWCSHGSLTMPCMHMQSRLDPSLLPIIRFPSAALHILCCFLQGASCSTSGAAGAAMAGGAAAPLLPLHPQQLPVH